MTKCDVCDNKFTQEIKLNYFTIVMCSRCGFGRLKELPSISEANKIYKIDYFNDKNGKDHFEDSKKKLSFISKYLKNNDEILDFGCGTGNFLLAAKTGNYNLTGYDISKSASKIAKEKTTLNVLSGNISPNSFKNSSLDCIVCFDVIEHLPDYRNKLLLFNKWLKTGGYLFITTPNIKSWDALLMGKSWYGFRKYPEHVIYFSPRSIKEILVKSSFEIRKVRLWGFIRSYKFILENTIKSKNIKNLVISVFDILNFSNKNLYVPMTDMMIVARKK